MKSLYYCRSRSVARAESHASESVTGATAQATAGGQPANGNFEPIPLAAAGADDNENDYEECLSCQ